ncbi:MAG: hypothetical protein AAFY21_17710, partial [Cyanobacteria bacterium J06641_2]
MTNVQAAHGVGKSFLAGTICVLWWVFACQGLCITTAPTKRQVEEILWREVRTGYDRNRLKLGGERGKTFVRVSANAYAFGFTAKSNDSNGFQGVHHDKLLVIIDESNGVSQEIDDGAISCATGAANRILRIGNPTEPGTPFESACKKSHIRIPVWTHPNVAWAYEKHKSGYHRLKPEVKDKIWQDDPDQPIKPQEEWDKDLPRDIIPGAVSIGWIEKQRLEKGEGSVFWMGRVEGIFPQDNSASIIPVSYFIAARARYDANPEYWEAEAARRKHRYGLDVGDGVDFHSLSDWQGNLLRLVKKKATMGDRFDTDRAAGLAVGRAKENPGVIAVDRIGVGAGTLTIILKQKYKAVGVNWGESAKDKESYANLKAEDFWLLREDMRKGDIAIAPLGEIEDEVMEDLAGIHYEEMSNGKIKIEDKKL